jgi:hypothetical protein
MVGLLVLMAIEVFHRLRACTGEKLDRRQEGLFILVALRLVALAGMAALAVYLLNPVKLGLQCCASSSPAKVGWGWRRVLDPLFALLDAPEFGQEPDR